MGVYIKGMEMPETTYECDFWNTDNICTANQKATVCDPANGIYPPEDCPLVEIPEPHGRLIDADKLTQKVKNNSDYFEGEGVEGCSYFKNSAQEPSTEIWVIEDWIENETTIIEAEGE